MLYPLKFIPVYKDYPWGGRNFEKFGRILPDGIIAESWEVSCHPNGVSIVSEGELAGTSLPELVERYGRKLMGTALPEKDIKKFPLLVKFIDADKNLSVQVHPDDAYAQANENGEYGKNEMWYIISAKPGARLVYDVKPGIDREAFSQAIKENRVESCLNYVEVFPGDVINIPAGLVHAIGEGIMLAEIQQNSDVTYRVYDYGRKGRTLHIKQALDVIDFNSTGRKPKTTGLKVLHPSGSSVTYLVANGYFSVELYEISGKTDERADGSRFFIYTFIEGEGNITWDSGTTSIKGGETILIPACLGEYSIAGRLKALKSYVPDIEENVIRPLKQAGYSENEIFENVAGLAR